MQLRNVLASGPDTRGLRLREALASDKQELPEAPEAGRDHPTQNTEVEPRSRDAGFSG